MDLPMKRRNSQLSISTSAVIDPVENEKRKRSRLEKFHHMIPHLVKTIAHGPYPITSIVNKAIKDLLIDTLNDQVNCTHKITVMRHLDKFLEEENEEFRRTFISTIGIEKFSITVDFSTSKSSDPFCVIIAHYITNCFDMKSFVFSFSKFSHPLSLERVQQKIKGELIKINPSWNGKEVEDILVSVTCGYASNNNCLTFENLPKMKCFGHRMNTLVSSIQKVDEWNDICEAVISVINQINNSDTNRNKLKDAQLQLIDAKKLSQTYDASKDRVKMPINLPISRWTYNPAVLTRAMYLKNFIAGIHIDQWNFTTNDEKQSFQNNMEIWMLKQVSNSIKCE